MAALASGHTDAEEGLIAALTVLTTMIGTPGGSTRPGWWLPSDGHASTAHPATSGRAETGMAHGIAGPLAFLSAAASAGWTVPNQTSAISFCAEWLLTWQNPDLHTWPPHITGDELDDEQPAIAPGRRDAWCYGSPGISRALHLAAQALQDRRFLTVADSSLAALANRPGGRWDTHGSTLCHGYSGVLQSTATSGSTAHDIAAAATQAAFDPRHAFAFQHQHAGSSTNDPGLLTGAAGVALALAEHGKIPSPTVPTSWDAVLLLS